MIGYHYTTLSAYEEISEVGLQLFPLEKRHRSGCREVLHLVKDGCIWVYTESMLDRALLGMLFYVASRHSSTRIVCLEVEYPDVHSASWLASLELDEDDTLCLRHKLEIGLPNGVLSQELAHSRQFDLITQPVLPKDFHLVGNWDLIELAQAGIVGTGARMIAA